MFCTNCGNKLNARDNFCGKCGKAVRASEVEKAEAPQPVRTEKPVFHRDPVPHMPEYTPPPSQFRKKPSELKAEKRREELRASLKTLLEKRYGREPTEDEMFDTEHWMRGMADLMWDIAVREDKLKKKLKENPKGFHLEGKGYSCAICGYSISDEETWYDEYGIKCLLCQKAIDDGVIPATAASDKESWYSEHDFEHHFFINRYGVRRLTKEGLLKARTISHPHRMKLQLFLIEDNKDILPPKKLTEWPMVKFQKDGEDWYHSEPWVQYKDPMETLKGYKILEYMQNLRELEISKSYPDLSFQLAKGSLYHVNYINKDGSKPAESDEEEQPSKSP